MSVTAATISVLNLNDSVKVVVFRSADPGYLIQTAMELGLQTRDAELDLAAMLGVMNGHADKRAGPFSSPAIVTGEVT